MSASVIPRAECIAAARAVFDRALYRIALDRAAGLLPPETELVIRRAERAAVEGARHATGPTDRAAA
ncbi:hypothetical protein [Streptomyces sp. NPDC001270]|uniref:hypothetical protein n=1 Tax=Streptomyces sp. NPDC001270 TaxID=3364554 RepID=UPI0036757B32